MPNITTFKTHKEYLQWYRDYRTKNREKMRKYTREYNARYRKEHGYAYELKYNKENRKKISAQHKAIRVYAIKKPCEVCGGEAIRHHPNYSYPLYIIWLCQKHHNWIHKVFTNKEMEDVTKEMHIEILKRLDKNGL